MALALLLAGAGCADDIDEPIDEPVIYDSFEDEMVIIADRVSEPSTGGSTTTTAG